MTNDILNQSIAAALIAADLSFSTLAGKLGTDPFRVFQLDFKVHDGLRIQLTGYISGSVFVVLSPLRVVDQETRRQVMEGFTTRMPLARLLPPASVQEDQAVVWVECAVPIPQGNEPVSPWLILPLFTIAATAVDYAAKSFGEHVSIPLDPPAPPMILTGNGAPPPRTPA